MFAVALILILAATAIVALWTAYGFRYQATRDGRSLPTAATLRELAAPASGSIDAEERAAASVLTVAARTRALPEACILGFASMLRDAHGRPSYVLGNVSTRGHWW